MTNELTITPTTNEPEDHKGWWIIGPTRKVWYEVGRMLKNDGYLLPVYSHIAVKVKEIDTSGLPYHLGVRIQKNYFAGD